MKNIFLLLFSLSLGNFLFGQQGSIIDNTKGFRAAVIKTNITPDNSQSLVDPISVLHCKNSC